MDLVRCSSGRSHLVADPAAPFYHLRYGVLVHAHAGFSDGIENNEVALQRIERSNGVL